MAACHFDGECIIHSSPYKNKRNGYAIVSWRGSLIRAHRLIYQQMVGEIPAGKFVCHICDNRGCVNIKHLFLGTQKENMRDAVLKGRMAKQQKTHCPKGHPYAGENLYIDKNGARNCKRCKSEKRKAYHRENYIPKRQDRARKLLEGE
jgi:hypothetical protein